MGFAFVYPNKPARYEVIDASTGRAVLWTNDLNEAHARARKSHPSIGVLGYGVWDWLGEDGIFLRDVKAFRAAGHKAEAAKPDELRRIDSARKKRFQKEIGQ